MINNNYYEYEWDSYYCYPNCFILKNKLNIIDEVLLEEAERQITAVRILDLKMNPLKGDLNFEHMLNIHKHIFNDIYEWAGKTRTVNISKGNQFCNYIFIENMADDIFLKLHNENYLMGLADEEMIIKLSYYLSELNAMHPFREGNGRTQRIFIEYLASVAGYNIDFSKVSSKEVIEASSYSFICDYRKMEDIFRNITNKITLDEQEKFIRSVARKGSVLIKAFEYWKKNNIYNTKG